MFRPEQKPYEKNSGFANTTTRQKIKVGKVAKNHFFNGPGPLRR